MSKETQIKQVREAYVRIRTIDHTISDDILDLMKDAAIEKLSQSSQPKGAEEGNLSAFQRIKGNIKPENMLVVEKEVREYWQEQCAEKDKEIEVWKKLSNVQKQTIANRDKEIAELKKSQQPELKGVGIDLQQLLVDYTFFFVRHENKPHAYLDWLQTKDGEKWQTVLQVFANQEQKSLEQLQFEGEIAGFKREEQKVSEGRDVLLSNLVYGYHTWVTPIEIENRKKHAPDESNTDPFIYLATPEAKELLSQLFEPQPVQGGVD
jgi:hypothetical protein